VQCNIEATTVDNGAQDEVHWELEGQKENKGREEQEKVELETCIQQVWCRAPTLGSTVHHVSVLGSVADTHRSNKIDIKNHTFIHNGKTHYKVHIT
jgi:hypothetical protein